MLLVPFNQKSYTISNFGFPLQMRCDGITLLMVKLGPLGWQRQVLETTFLYVELSWMLDSITVQYYVLYNKQIHWYIINITTLWYVYVCVSHHHIASVFTFHWDCWASHPSPFCGHRLMSSRAGHPGRTAEAKNISTHTVDGRNPAPVDMVNITLFTGFHACWVVQDFFHQLYHVKSRLNTSFFWNGIQV